MAIYKNSRYSTGLNIYYDRKQDTTYMDFPETSIQVAKDDFVYRLRSGESIEFLANQFYGSPHLKWIILYANPQYTSEFEIRAGDTLVIPTKERVMDYVNGSK